MSAVMSVLPSGASHGIACGVSVSRKNGNSGSGRPRHRVREQAPARGSAGSRTPSAGSGTARKRSSASVPSTMRGSTLIGAVLITAAAGHLLAGDPHADGAAVAHGDALDRAARAGSSRPPRSARLLAHRRDAVLGVDVPDVGALRRLAAVADRHRAVGQAGRDLEADGLRRCCSGSCRRPRARARSPARRTRPRSAGARSRRRARRRTRAGTTPPR